MAYQPLPGPPTLASGLAEIPLQAGMSNPDLGVRAPPEVDYTGQQTKGLALQDAYRGDQMQQEQMADKDVLKQYQKSGGDLQTPDGIQKAIQDLQGKVSAKTYQDLVKMQRTSDEWVAKQTEAYAQAGEAKLKTYGQLIESTQKALAPAMEIYEDAVKVKGDAGARVDFDAAKKAALTQLQQLKGPDGKPLLSPEAMKEYEDMTPEQLRSKSSTATWKMKQLQEAATIAKEKAQGTQAQSTADLNKAKQGQIEEGGAALAAYNAAVEQYGENSPQAKAVLAKMQGAPRGSAPGVDESTVSPEQRRLAVNQWIQNPSSMRGMDKTYQQRVVAWAAKLGITPEEVNSGQAKKKFELASAGASGRRAGTMAAVEATMPGLIEQAKQASAAVDRTSFVPFNKLLQMGEGAISDPALKRLKVANQAVASEFQQVIARGGSNVTSLNEAMHLLQTADSPEAYNAALEQIKKEIEVNVAGTQKVHDNLAPELGKKLGAVDNTGARESADAGQIQAETYLQDIKRDLEHITADLRELHDAIPKAQGTAKSILQERLKVVEAAKKMLGGATKDKVLSLDEYLKSKGH